MNRTHHSFVCFVISSSSLSRMLKVLAGIGLALELDLDLELDFGFGLGFGFERDKQRLI
jgi:hypothetical protein